MKAVVLTKYGDIHRLVYSDVPDPVPRPGELGIRVHAAGLNFGDVLIRQGLHKDSPRPPAVHGMEVAGVVETAPAGGFFPPGERALPAPG